MINDAPLAYPFFVIATQNPIESEGTYRLPEAQVDRFMFKLVTDYPVEQDEFKILAEHSQHIDTKDKLLKFSQFCLWKKFGDEKIVNDVYVAPQLRLHQQDRSSNEKLPSACLYA